MKPFDLEAAKNGAPVCTADGKKARIICFDKEGAFPLVALISSAGNEVIMTYTKDGVDSCLLGTPCDLMMCEKPQSQPQLKPFDRVLVRDNEHDVWKCDFFSHKKGIYYTCVGSFWKQCIPYEGNEHLIGTPNNPKED